MHLDGQAQRGHPVPGLQPRLPPAGVLRFERLRHVEPRAEERAETQGELKNVQKHKASRGVDRKTCRNTRRVEERAETQGE